MAYLKAQLFSGSERCSRCNEPMDKADNPGIIITEFTRENGRVQIWVHIECIQQLLFDVRRKNAVALLAGGAKP